MFWPSFQIASGRDNPTRATTMLTTSQTTPIDITAHRRTSEKPVFAHDSLREALDTVLEDPAVATIFAIDAGKNRSYRVTLQDGTVLFLKVGTRFPDRFPAEPRTMEILRRSMSLPIPEVHATGEQPLKYPFSVYEFVDGTDMNRVSDLPLTTAERLCREAGRNLCALHRMTFPEFGEVGVEDGSLSVIEPRSFNATLHGSTDRQLSELRETVFADRCDAIEARGAELIEGINFDRISPALVHGDYRFENLCVDPTGEQVTAAILDWELPTAADPLWDAVMARALLADGYGLDPETSDVLSTAFWDGYGEDFAGTTRRTCYELLARVRLARHVEAEMVEESEAAVDRRIREHEAAFDALLATSSEEVGE